MKDTICASFHGNGDVLAARRSSDPYHAPPCECIGTINNLMLHITMQRGSSQHISQPCLIVLINVLEDLDPTIQTELCSRLQSLASHQIFAMVLLLGKSSPAKAAEKSKSKKAKFLRSLVTSGYSWAGTRLQKDFSNVVSSVLQVLCRDTPAGRSQMGDNGLCFPCWYMVYQCFLKNAAAAAASDSKVSLSWYFGEWCRQHGLDIPKEVLFCWHDDDPAQAQVPPWDTSAAERDVFIPLYKLCTNQSNSSQVLLWAKDTLCTTWNWFLFHPELGGYVLDLFYMFWFDARMRCCPEFDALLARALQARKAQRIAQGTGTSWSEHEKQQDYCLRGAVLQDVDDLQKMFSFLPNSVPSLSADSAEMMMFLLRTVVGFHLGRLDDIWEMTKVLTGIHDNLSLLDALPFSAQSVFDFHLIVGLSCLARCQFTSARLWLFRALDASTAVILSDTSDDQRYIRTLFESILLTHFGLAVTDAILFKDPEAFIQHMNRASDQLLALYGVLFLNADFAPLHATFTCLRAYIWTCLAGYFASMKTLSAGLLKGCQEAWWRLSSEDCHMFLIEQAQHMREIVRSSYQPPELQFVLSHLHFSCGQVPRRLAQIIQTVFVATFRLLVPVTHHAPPPLPPRPSNVCLYLEYAVSRKEVSLVLNLSSSPSDDQKASCVTSQIDMGAVITHASHATRVWSRSRIGPLKDTAATMVETDESLRAWFSSHLHVREDTAIHGYLLLMFYGVNQFHESDKTLVLKAGSGPFELDRFTVLQCFQELLSQTTSGRKEDLLQLINARLIAYKHPAIDMTDETYFAILYQCSNSLGSLRYLLERFLFPLDPSMLSKMLALSDVTVSSNSLEILQLPWEHMLALARLLVKCDRDPSRIMPMEWGAEQVSSTCVSRVVLMPDDAQKRNLYNDDRIAIISPSCSYSVEFFPNSIESKRIEDAVTCPRVVLIGESAAELKSMIHSLTKNDTSRIIEDVCLVLQYTACPGRDASFDKLLSFYEDGCDEAASLAFKLALDLRRSGIRRCVYGYIWLLEDSFFTPTAGAGVDPTVQKKGTRLNDIERTIRDKAIHSFRLGEPLPSFLLSSSPHYSTRFRVLK
jgi:hypothetical protein